MPRSPLSLCPHANCPELVAGGRCQQHRAQRRAAYDQARGSAASRGYDQTWRNFVQAYRHGRGLDASEPDFAAKLVARNRCAQCWAEGIDSRWRGLRLEYDHIVPLTAGGARLDPNNVQPLCHAHHVAKTRRESC